MSNWLNLSASRVIDCMALYRLPTHGTLGISNTLQPKRTSVWRKNGTLSKQPNWVGTTGVRQTHVWHICFSTTLKWKVLHSPLDRCTWLSSRAHRKRWHSGTDDSDTSEADKDIKNWQFELKEHFSNVLNPLIFQEKRTAHPVHYFIRLPMTNHFSYKTVEQEV